MFCSSIDNIKCTPSDRQMYPRLGTPTLYRVIHTVCIVLYVFILRADVKHQIVRDPLSFFA